MSPKSKNWDFGFWGPKISTQQTPYTTDKSYQTCGDCSLYPTTHRVFLVFDHSTSNTSVWSTFIPVFLIKWKKRVFPASSQDHHAFHF
jgi:hypothetical protein